MENQKSKKRYRKVSQETVDKLRALYQEHTAKECARILHLPASVVIYQIQKNHIDIEDRTTVTKAAPPPHSVSLSEPINKHRERMLSAIRSEYADNPTSDVAEQTCANYYTVSRAAGKLGIKKTKSYMRKRWSTGNRTSIGKERRQRIEEYLRQHFSDTRNSDLAEALGIDPKTVRRYARRLGLVKTKAFMDYSRSKKFGGYSDEFKAWRLKRIAEVFQKGSAEDLQKLAEELYISVGTIKTIAYTNGIRRAKKEDDKAFIESLREYFPTHTDRECAEHFGTKIDTIWYLARKFSLYKDKDHVKEVRLENGNRAFAGWKRKQIKKQDIAYE